MTETHRPRAEQADLEIRQQMVNLLAAEIERAYAVEGPTRAGQTLRQMLMSLDRPALAAMVYELGLDTEPEFEDDEPDQRERGGS
jgi:hypothetical protein